MFVQLHDALAPEKAFISGGAKICDELRENAFTMALELEVQAEEGLLELRLRSAERCTFFAASVLCLTLIRMGISAVYASERTAADTAAQSFAKYITLADPCRTLLAG